MIIQPILSTSTPAWEQVREACRVSPIGKRLPDALYVHNCALGSLELILQEVVTIALTYVPPDLTEIIILDQSPILVKFMFSEPRISFLSYPQFETDPHPALEFSFQVNLSSGITQRRDYGNTQNPPILHRKETFITPHHPKFQDFSTLTQQEETLGLLKQSRHIGTRFTWQKRLQDFGIEIYNHRLACSLKLPDQTLRSSSKPQIDRHKAAIHRKTLSKPVRLAVESGLLPPNTTFFDYGCGHGEDVALLIQAGCIAEGWDPFYQPDQPWMKADVVNLGYIINVIEDPTERREAVVNAWELTRRVLIISAQVLVENLNQEWLAYGDGVITSRNTFQKYYEQEELKVYIDQALGVDAIPIALGIYLIFRDQGQSEQFRASWFHSRANTPRVRSMVSQFEDYKLLLQPLMDFYRDRGRLPTAEEVKTQKNFQAILDKFQSIKQAFNLILKATNSREWDALRDQRCQDWLVYLALTQFGKRPRFSELDHSSQVDIKSLFGSYKEACTAADLMLVSVGNLELIRESCHRSSIGLYTQDSLWIHCDFLETLEPLLRLYEGCGSRIFGRFEGTTIVRLHWKKAAITYYKPLNFDEEAHPILINSMKISLGAAKVFYRDYDPKDNPPILIRKDRLVSVNYPNYEKFSKLSYQEVNWGILESLETPGQWWTKKAWDDRLRDRGAALQGHRLVWRKDLDPYRRKLLESEQRSLKLKIIKEQSI